MLPPAALASLRDFTVWIRYRDAVIVDWKARPLGGPLALFCGPSGSGKSFAAAVVAAELSAQTGESWALYALDLGRIMSKYVGETEQNLNALLDALDGRRAILQIDEADGLLGKRGEVTDARDRYANLEVSHMLSRFERHAGPVILTTNLRANIDAAFLRRFQQIVDFPAPDTRRASDAVGKAASRQRPARAGTGHGRTGKRRPAFRRSDPQRRILRLGPRLRTRRADRRRASGARRVGGTVQGQSPGPSLRTRTARPISGGDAVRIRRIRLVLPPRMRHGADSEARHIAETVAQALAGHGSAHGAAAYRNPGRRPAGAAHGA